MIRIPFTAIRRPFWRGFTMLLIMILSIVAVALLLAGAAESAAPRAVLLQTVMVDNRLMVDPDPLVPAIDYERSGGQAGISVLGGQRDLVQTEGLTRIQWDGDDGLSEQLDHTGLGGLDITDGGLRDRFELEILSGAPESQAELTVYSDEQNASRVVVSLEIPGRISLPLEDFSAAAGEGADFTRVGAVELEIQGDNAALSLGALELSSNLSLAQADFLLVDQNGDGQAGPGDVVERQISITNDGDRNSREVTISRNLFSRAAELVNGSVSTTQGLVLSGNRDGQQVIRVEVGSLDSGASAVVSFQQVITQGFQVPVEVILQDNDAPPGGGGLLVDAVNYPVTDGSGSVGFTGDLDNGTNDTEFVWHGTALEWLSTDILSDVSSIESFMGVGDGVAFAVSPILNPGSLDAAWSQDGKLVAEGDPAPDLTNQFITFASRPTMLPNGTAHWVSGYADTPGGTTQNRVLYRSIDTATPVISAVIKSGDVISGFVVDSSYDFDYFFSDSGSHHIQVLDMEGSTTEDFFIYLDGALIHREGQPIDATENWDNFDLIQVNDSGDYIFSGDTDGDTATDEFLAYNSAIQVREGDIVGGVPLTSSAFVRVASINNLGQAAYAWGVSGGAEILFFACDASDLTQATVVLVTDDMVDVDGDGNPDATVTDFNTSTATQAFMLAEDGKIYLEVDLDYGAGNLEAIIALDAPVCQVQEPEIDVVPGTLSSSQPADTQMVETMTISNTGDADLAWELFEEGGAPGGDTCNPVEISWASADPLSGTIPGPGAQDVDVTFDSSGLSPGEYTAGLCIESNDADEPAVRVPLTLTVIAQPAIDLTKTVGTDQMICAATNSINIPAGGGGTQVTYCYTVMNTGDITLTLHTLVDDKLGALLTDFPYDLAPGASVFLTTTTLITQTTVNTATWTATVPGTPSVSDSATATVTRSQPTSVAFSKLTAERATMLLPVFSALLLAALLAVFLVRGRRQGEIDRH